VTAGGRFPATTLLGESVVLDDLAPTRRGRAYPAAGTTAALLLPAGLLLGTLVVWPVVRIVHASLTSPGRGFVGLTHFRTALDTEGAAAVFGRTALWAIVVPAVVTAVGFALAWASPRGRSGGVLALVLVAPIALPLVVTGVAFRLLYDPDPSRGTVARLLGWGLERFGGDRADVPELLGPRLVTLALMSAFVWAWVGLAVVVFRAALTRLPPELADVVKAHGGSRLDVVRDAFWRPLLRRTSAIVFALVAVGTVRTFDLILVMAPGSVRDDASVLAVLQWQTSAGTTTGPAAALGVLWLGAVALGVVAAARWSRQPWPLPPRQIVPRAWPGQVVDWVRHPRLSRPRLPRLGLPRPHAPGFLHRTARPAPDARPDWHDRWAQLGGPLGTIRRVAPAAVVVAWLIPLAVLVLTSLRGTRAAATTGWWTGSFALQLGAYHDAFSGDALTRSLVLTGALAIVVTVVVLVLALPTAYALAWRVPPGAPVVGFLLLGAAVVPIQVIAGPITEVFDALGVTSTWLRLALVHVALGLPFGVLVLRNALSDVSLEQIRQARLAGRPEHDVVRRKMLPAIASAGVAVAVLEFVQVWNDLVVGLLFGGAGTTPIGLLVQGQTRQFVTNSGPLAAASVVASIVPVVLVLLARDEVVDGLVGGAIR
jgi:alpha-glucoside transport system permease protein